MLQVVVQAPPTPLPPNIPFWATLPPGIVLVIVFALVAGGVAVFLPLMKAFAARIAGGGRMDPAIAEELEHLRSRVADVDGLQSRVAELEERVDFTERLLAQKREPEQLGR
jgi:Tfp pilus assembly protein PilO